MSTSFCLSMRIGYGYVSRNVNRSQMNYNYRLHHQLDADWVSWQDVSYINRCDLYNNFRNSDIRILLVPRVIPFVCS